MTTHPLTIYREQTSKSIGLFASQCGVSRMTIWRIENGKQTPSLDLVARIIEATGGAVSAGDFLPKASAA